MSVQEFLIFFIFSLFIQGILSISEGLLPLPYNVTNPYPRAANQQIRIMTQSCNYQHYNNNKLWAYMVVSEPDLVTLLGDTIYLDAQPCHEEKENCETMWDELCDYVDCDKSIDLTCFNYCWSEIDWYTNPWEQYKILLNDTQFTLNKLYAGYQNWPVPIIAIWDDHDYCQDNTDRNCTWKNITRDAYVDFIEEIDYSGSFTNDIIYLKNHNDSGIYYYYDYNKTVQYNGQSVNLKVRFYNLDVRWYRSKTDMLGIEQRTWFENLLLNNSIKDINYHIICTGSVYYPSFGIGQSFAEPWDTWSKQWFVNVTSQANIRKQLIILSGDVHYSALYRDDYVFEIVTSAMTHGIADTQAAYLETEQEDYLVGDIITAENIGIFDLQFDGFSLKFVDNEGKLVGNYSYNYLTDTLYFSTDDEGTGNFLKMNWSFLLLSLIYFFYY